MIFSNISNQSECNLDNLPFVISALFTFRGRVSVRREAPDTAASDEAIASAIFEELDAVDRYLVADQKGEQRRHINMIIKSLTPPLSKTKNYQTN
jgi:hypothetical protein